MFAYTASTHPPDAACEIYAAPTVGDRRMWDLWLSRLHQPAIVAAEEAGIFSALAESSRHRRRAGDATRLFDERATTSCRQLAALRLLLRQDGRISSHEARNLLVKGVPGTGRRWPASRSAKWNGNRLLEKLRHAARIRWPDRRDASGVCEGRAADDWAAGHVSTQRGPRGCRADARALRAGGRGRGGTLRLQRHHPCARVGGGSGCFMVTAAQAHPHLHCTVMELPAMCEAASAYIHAGGVADRVDTCAVDMFRQPWPRGYDTLFFSNIWHDWNVRTCRWLAGRSREVLPDGGRIMLHEMLVDDDGGGPATAAAFSMLMLLATQGQQFTFGELKAIRKGQVFAPIDVDRHAPVLLSRHRHKP